MGVTIELGFEMAGRRYCSGVTVMLGMDTCSCGEAVAERCVNCSRILKSPLKFMQSASASWTSIKAARQVGVGHRIS